MRAAIKRLRSRLAARRSARLQRYIERNSGDRAAAGAAESRRNPPGAGGLGNFGPNGGAV